MKNKKLLLLIIVVIVIGLLGVSFAFFEYYGESANHRVKTGVVKLNFNEDTDTISLTNIFPETKEEARARTDNVITFTVSGVNTTTNKDIWYEIMLNEGATLEGKTRFNHNDMVFDLVEINSDKTETLVVDAMSYNDFNARRIWVNTVNRETETEITKTYKLRMWLSEDVKISDTNPEADYSTSVFKNSYASVRVSVYGDFLEKQLPVRLSKQIEDTLPLTDPNIDGTRYVYGQTEDNYLWYSGKLWRIVSINGDGSIKLVTQGNMTTLAWDTSSTNTDYSTSQIHTWINNEFLPTLYDADNLLVDSTWDYTTYAEATATKVEPTATVDNEKVGLLTIYDYYSSGASSGFLNNGYYWWTMSPRTCGAYVWYVGNLGIYNDSPFYSYGVRPSINMKSNIQIVNGNGTKSNPFQIVGDKNVGSNFELLNNRISGEYINFNDVLYRIVGTEEIEGQILTKITMADYSVNKNTIGLVTFGADASQRIYSPTYGIGLYLEEWYQADSTSETYATMYIKENYKAMIATSGENGDNVVWYTGPTSGVDRNTSYTLSKTGTSVPATIGLGHYGEMFASQFGDGYGSSNYTWLMTTYSNSDVWHVSSGGDSYYLSPADTRGVRPSFYLKSGVKITGGSGMPNDPYEIEYEPKTLVDTIIDSVGTSGLVAVATDGTLYTDETTQTLRDYRFSGSNDVVTNNYVNFDGDLWRIIGVMPTEKEDGTTENLIKIIKATPLTAEEIPTTYTYNGVEMTLKDDDTSNTAYWNDSRNFNQTNLNDWTKAAVQYFLNDETSSSNSYYNSIAPIYQKMIQKSVYHLGNVDLATTTKDSYIKEQSSTVWEENEKTWTGNIGLMYPSDYGYAADSTYWDTTMDEYYNEAYNYDWLYDNSNDRWAISPTSYDSVEVMLVNTDGDVVNDVVYHGYYALSPVLYLKSNVKILGGTGLEGDAYQLG